MTDHVLSFLSAYQNTLAEAFSLPQELARDYELYDCLHETPEKSSYLLRRPADESFALLKIASNQNHELLYSEFEVLSTLHSPLFPKAICCFSDEETTYFLREYVAGVPVSSYVEQHGTFPEKEAVRLCAGLCEALQLLHAQTPPVIHRDIKPQNVIFTKERTLRLIDFDAARRYQSEQKRDTVFLGTQATAAPEQFGYQQTDQRSDIYSTGILLLFLCTGSYEMDSLGKIQSRTLRSIIETATRFDPKRRFGSARLLRKQLQCQLRIKNTSASFWSGAAVGLACGISLSAALFLCGVFPATRQNAETQTPTPALAAAATQDNTPVTFDSPAFEQVVRQKLGVDESTPLYQKDLDSITSLYLFGTTLLNDWNDVLNKAQYSKPNQAGTIITLSDLKKLHNLSELALCYQSISDLTPLTGLHLARLALNGNLIKDLAPIASMPSLQELLIGQNPIYSIDALASCASLQCIDLGDTYVVDLSPLGANMKSVYLKDTPVIDYSPLLKMHSLRDLFVTDLNEEDLAILSQLTGLITLVLSDSLADISPILTLKNLRSLALSDKSLASIAGIEALEKLTYFRVIAGYGLDLTPLTKLPRLIKLDIYTQPLADYSVLFRISSLQTLYCSQEQKDAISALDYTKYFQMIVLG